MRVEHDRKNMTFTVIDDADKQLFHGTDDELFRWMNGLSQDDYQEVRLWLNGLSPFGEPDVCDRCGRIYCDHE